MKALRRGTGEAKRGGKKTGIIIRKIITVENYYS